MNEAIHVSEESFEASVLKSALPVLVAFWAPWCPACRTITPILDDMARSYSGRLLVAKVDTDQYPDLATRYGAGRIPTLVFISEGRIVAQSVGVVSFDVIRGKIEGVLKKGDPLDRSIDRGGDSLC